MLIKYYNKIYLFIIFLILSNCVDPVKPKFEFKEDLILIEGTVSNINNNSFVTIKRSFLSGNDYINSSISDAIVKFIKTETNEAINLTFDQNTYVPPNNFKTEVGETWELHITLKDGTEYKSLPETSIAPVPIENTKVSYSNELSYSESLEKFIPGHTISIDLKDPIDTKNYYFWGFRSFEKIDYCARCFDGIFRDGVCVKNPENSDRKDYYDYYCESDCWRKRYNNDINIYSDEFSNGLTIQNLPVANILLYTKKNILVEIQQLSLTAAAYNYYKTIKDLVDNNGNFNAPPPAALIGNLYNPNNKEEFVLGRFTVAAVSTKSVFINRENIIDEQIEPKLIRQFEECIEVCEPDDCEKDICSPVNSINECGENRLRTQIKPLGWID